MARGPLKKPVKSGEERKKHINKQTKRTEGMNPLYRIKETWAKYCVELFEQGLTDEEVKQHLMFQKEMSIYSAKGYCDVARAIIRNEHTKDRETVVGLHLRRYDQDIHRLINFVPKTNNFQRAKELKIRCYFQVLDLLHQKEKLIGFHSKKMNIKINNNINVVVNEKPKNYDLSALTLEEKIDLMNLLSKAKKDQHEIIDIKPNPNKIIQQQTEDVEYVEVKEQINNIDSIEQVIPEEPKKEVEVLKIVDLKLKLAKALREKAQKEFIKAGSTTATNDDINHVR